MSLNLGSGSSTLQGGNQALQDAIARRATGQGSQTQSQTPASAGFQPGLAAPQLPNPQASPASTVPGGSPVAPQPSLMGAPQLNTAAENDLILKALDAKLRNNANIEKFQVKGGA